MLLSLIGPDTIELPVNFKSEPSDEDRLTDSHLHNEIVEYTKDRFGNRVMKGWEEQVLTAQPRNEEEKISKTKEPATDDAEVDTPKELDPVTDDEEVDNQPAKAVNAPLPPVRG